MISFLASYFVRGESKVSVPSLLAVGLADD
jgi:hypothetical protein